MRILAIETSCDETACSIVEDGKKVLTNAIASQIDLHAKTGGVVPEVAARMHVLKMIPILEEAMGDYSWDDIDAIAVTKGPGLVSSLIIGTETASVISFVKGKPLIPVNHISGHIYSAWLDIEETPKLPILVLTVSGGHNELVLMRGHHDFEVLGETRDDAAGEAFDKVARLLGMGYPGGPVIDKAARNGNKKAFDFPRAYLEKGSLDFSFSGLKTAVLTAVREYVEAHHLGGAEGLDDEFKNNVAASFQEAVVEVLVKKTLMALDQYPEVKEVHVVGGVSANSRLRELMKESLKDRVLRFPQSIRYCTDNAAMIAGSAYYLWQQGEFEAANNVIPRAEFGIV